MFFKKKDPLQLELSRCRKESNRAYRHALSICDKLSGVLADCKTEIAKGYDTLEECSATDGTIKEVTTTLSTQLNAIERELVEDWRQTYEDLKVKNKSDQSFNITLFGRTMVGKSTLMAILTQGNEDAIGIGSQRTTRDVKQYQWQGMTITDVPGIDAFDGQEDDTIAQSAAKNADLIIFMISSGQPESTEADWLIKLKKEDKAVICLCNYKKSLKTKPILDRALNDTDAFIAKMELKELKEQVNEFIRTELPNERIDIFVVMLLAELLSRSPEYAQSSDALHEISQFATFTDELLAQISARGVFYRRKSYMALVDAPIYQHYLSMMRFANDAYSGWMNVRKTQNDFTDWEKVFNPQEKTNLTNEIKGIFAAVERSVAGFVEDNVERDHIDKLWAAHLDAYNLEHKVKAAIQKSIDRCQSKINEIFADMAKDFDIAYRLNSTPVYGFGRQTNWKRAWGWGGSIAGLGSTIVFIAGLSNPIGWVFAGASLLCGIFSWFCDSREEKLKNARKRMYDQISRGLEQMKEKAIKNAIRQFDNAVCDRMQRMAYGRLRAIQATLLTALNVERRCAIGYGNQHAEIARHMISNIISTFNSPDGKAISVELAARIPGRKIVIVSHSYISDSARRYISARMGCNEPITVISLNIHLPLSSQVNYLAKIFTPDVFLKCKLLKSGDYVIYAPKKDYTQEQSDGFDIIQQLLHIPIILTNV